MLLTELFAWIELEPKKYYKDGRLYGLVGTVVKDDCTYVAATVVDTELPFTIGMFRDIIRLYDKGKVCLIADSPDKQKLIRSASKRYGLTHEYVDGVMYSYGGKDEFT